MLDIAHTQLRLDIFQQVLDQRLDKERDSVVARYIEGHLAREEVAGTLAQADAKVYRQAEEAARRGTSHCWATIRKQVWERDGPVCKVCGLDFSEIPQMGEVGHCVDRILGGQDTLENLDMMCYYCNRFKPLHLTRSEYEQWKETGGWLPEFLDFASIRISEFAEMTSGGFHQFWSGLWGASEKPAERGSVSIGEKSAG